MDCLESGKSGGGRFITYGPARPHGAKWLILPIFYIGIALDLEASD